MGLDFIERFFKLTLDNIYRFGCSLLFIVALVGGANQSSPVEQLTRVLDWLAVPSSWLLPVGEWVDHRQIVVGVAAALALIVAVGFAAANDWHSRSGSTVLLSFVILTQVGQGAWIVNAAFFFLVGLALVTGFATATTRRLGWHTPGWVRPAWEKFANVFFTLCLAAVYLLSPFGWLISQEPHNARGSRRNPLYIEQVERTGPSGAIRLQ